MFNRIVRYSSKVIKKFKECYIAESVKEMICSLYHNLRCTNNILSSKLKKRCVKGDLSLLDTYIQIEDKLSSLKLINRKVV